MAKTSKSDLAGSVAKVSISNRTKGPRLSKEKRRTIRQRRIFIWSFLGLPILSFLVFYVYANFNSIVMAFQRPVYGGESKYVWSTENFSRIKDLLGSAGGGKLTKALVNTLLMWSSGMLIGLPLSVLACYFFYVKIPGARLFRSVMYLPQIITSSALVVLFKYAIGQGGPLDMLMSSGGGAYTNPLTTQPSAMITIIFYSVSFGFGTNIILLGSAMNSINTEMIEAGRVDGCTWFKELTHIILPTIWPTVSTIIILSTAGILGSTGPILAFTKGEVGTMTLSFYIYQLVSGAGTGVTDLNLASAIGIAMTVVSLPFVFLVKRVVYGKEED